MRDYYRKSRFCGPRDASTMQNHLLQNHLACVLHAQRYHGQTVADKDHVHASVVGDMSAREVMRRDHRDRFLLLM